MCGCNKNAMRNTSVRGSRPVAGIRSFSTGPTPAPVAQPQPRTMSFAPQVERSVSGAGAEKRKLQKLRRDAIRNQLGKG